MSSVSIKHLPNQKPLLRAVKGSIEGPEGSVTHDLSIAHWEIWGGLTIELSVGAKLLLNVTRGHFFAEVYFTDMSNKEFGTWRTYEVTFPGNQYDKRHDAELTQLLKAELLS